MPVLTGVPSRIVAYVLLTGGSSRGGLQQGGSSGGAGLAEWLGGAVLAVMAHIVHSWLESVLVPPSTWCK